MYHKASSSLKSHCPFSLTLNIINNEKKVKICQSIKINISLKPIIFLAILSLNLFLIHGLWYLIASFFYSPFSQINCQ